MRTLLLSTALVLAACTGSEIDDTPAPDTSAQAAPGATTASERPRLTQAAEEEAAARRNPQAPTLASIAEPQLEVQTLNPSMEVFMNSGGNVLVLYGDDGALLVDDKFARNADEILARINDRAGVLPTYVLNTHYHGDHSGSNVEMKNVGALVIAQDGTRELMSREVESALFGRTTEPREDAAHPDMTFRQEMKLNFADQEVHLIHVPNAHTGGDLLAHFPDADVIHMGDTMFNGMLPYFDIESGGSLEGLIAAQGFALRTAGPGTTIVPGHGPVTDKAGLQESYDLLLLIRDRMSAEIDKGSTMEAAVAADIFDDLGMDDGFINQDRISQLAYRSLTQ